MQGDRTERGPLTRIRNGGDLLAITSPADLCKPGCAARSPGFLFLYAPLAESGYAHASEACLSGFESRVGYQNFLRERKRSRLLFYNLDVAKTPRRACSELTSRAAGP